jgi:integrase
MKIEKLPSGSYRVRKMYKGQTYSVIFDYKPTQKEAMQAMSAELDKVQGKHERMTFETAAKNYIASKSNILSPSTEREYTRTINRLSQGFRSLNISDITQNDIQKEINRFAKKLAPKTVRNYHGFISAVLGSYQPELKIYTTLPQKVKKEPYIPSDRDVKIIMEHSIGTMFEIPILLGCYGLRRSEICALNIETDLENNVLHVNKAMVMNKDNKWVIKSTKTTVSARDVIISPKLADKMRNQGYVYQGHPNSISDYLGRIEAKYDIPHFSLHKLRHYFASKMSALKIPEVDILAMGGWETDYVMKAVYRHSMEDSRIKSQKRASDKLAKIILS